MLRSCLSAVRVQLQVFVDGPCGSLLYGRRLTQETVAAFCERPVEGRHCWASFVARLDAHRERTGPACGLLAAVEGIVQAWCYKDAVSNPNKYCFVAVEEALEAADLRSLGSKTSSQLDDVCGEQSCLRSNLRYLDNMTLLQTAWQLLHAPVEEEDVHDTDAARSPYTGVLGGRYHTTVRARRLEGQESADSAGRKGFYDHMLRLQDALDRAERQMRSTVSNASYFTVLEQPPEAIGRLPVQRNPLAMGSTPVRRLSTLSRFQGPLTETLEEGLNLVCTKVEGEYCQQTLVLLAQESPIRTPSLLLEPCASRCFVPLTGAVGAIVEAYGERHRDPWHALLGSVMRAYGRFYCVRNERGDVCGKHFFDRYKAANPHKVAAQGLELPLPDCQCPHSFLQVTAYVLLLLLETCGYPRQQNAPKQEVFACLGRL